MKKLTTRRLGIAGAFVLLLIAYFVGNLLSEMKSPPPRREAYEAVAEVDVIRVSNGTVSTSLNVQGQLVAFDKIDLFAEVSGTLIQSSRPFKVGSYFPKGSLLLRIEDEEARLTILSQKANLLNAITQMMPDFKVDYPESYDHWQRYLDSFDIEGPLHEFPAPADRQERFFIASRDLYSQYYNIKSAEERLSKYQIVAPFSGVITAASIHPGALVRNGQKLGELMSTGTYELEALVPLSDLGFIGRGNHVELHSDDIEGSWTGSVTRINDQVDPGTQTVRVFVQVSGRDLKEGMYLKGEIEAQEIEEAVRLPREALVDQQAVYAVRDSVLELRQIDVLKVDPQYVILRGLKDGETILESPLPSAFDGMRVRIRNEAVMREERPQSEAEVGG